MWQTSPPNPKLTVNDVHVWQVNLDIPSEQVQLLTKILSEDEIARANRFYFEQHRRRFIVARSHLRIILGRYLQIKPEQLKFEYNSHGKPYLANQDNSLKIQFNVSHSQELALYGFAVNHLIGVDLEYLRRMDDAESIAKRFFSPQEFELINSVNSEDRAKVFFQLWAAKEAYLKATGDGLGGGLEQVEIEIISDHLSRFFRIEGDYQKTNNWCLHSLIPTPNYIGAIVIENRQQEMYNIKQFLFSKVIAAC